MDNKYKYQHSQFLNLIYEASKEGLIDQYERIKIKEMIITQNQALEPLYDQYNSSGDSQAFIVSAQALVQGLGTPNEVAQESSEDDQKKKNDIMSSPNDAALMRMKKRRNSKQLSKKEVKAPEMFGGSVQQCEEGLSPKVSFTKKFKKDEDDDDSDDN